MGDPLKTWLAVSLLVLSVGGSSARAQGTSTFRTIPDKPQSTVTAQPTTWIDRTRPYLPEWLAEVVEVGSGGQMAPGRGWFASGVSRTRFDWKSVRDRLDADHDGSISPKEFGGPAADFRRLDQNQTGTLTSIDFVFPDNSRARSRSRMVMSFADRNGDGRVDTEEFKRMHFLATRDDFTRYRYFSDAVPMVVERYTQSDLEKMPFLAISDLRDTVDLAAHQKGLETIPDPDGDIDVTTTPTLWKGLIRHELGSPHVGPRPGESAPEFHLPTDDRKGQVSLSSLLGPKPVVLIFSSLTSETLRGEAGTLEKLYRHYGSRARFLMVYVRESHPTDGWALKQKVKVPIAVVQPTTELERSKVAQDCRKKLNLTFPIVVDSMDDRVGILYSGMPDRLYLLDRQGKVAYQGGRGPFGFKPDELEQSLLLLLQAERP